MGPDGPEWDVGPTWAPVGPGADVLRESRERDGLVVTAVVVPVALPLVLLPHLLRRPAQGVPGRTLPRRGLHRRYVTVLLGQVET